MIVGAVSEEDGQAISALRGIEEDLPYKNNVKAFDESDALTFKRDADGNIMLNDYGIAQYEDPFEDEVQYQRKKNFQDEDANDYTPYGLRWMYDYTDKQDVAQLSHALANTDYRKYKWYDTEVGRVKIVRTESAVVYCDGKYKNPIVYAVAYAISEDREDVLTKIMEDIQRDELRGNDQFETLRALQFVFGEEQVRILQRSDVKEKYDRRERTTGGFHFEEDGEGKEVNEAKLDITGNQDPGDMPGGDVVTDSNNEVQFSRARDRELYDLAEALNAKDGYVSIEAMREAQKTRAAVKAYMEDPENAKKLQLPPDIEGTTFYEDSSYGGTAENLTVCPRSLAAQELLDKVGKQLGRPLTVEDTVVISQALENI